MSKTQTTINPKNFVVSQGASMTMLNDTLTTDLQNGDTVIQVTQSQSKRSLQQDQEIIYDFLLKIVKEWSPPDVLLEFKRLFIDTFHPEKNDALESLYHIAFINDEQEFTNTLKRSCYIIVNYWEVNRQHHYIQELINLFYSDNLNNSTLSPVLIRLRRWIAAFIHSKDFDDLKIFAQKNDTEIKENNWSSRYNSYLLVSQYLDFNNPFEQREAARRMAKKLKDQFKFDLAMYTAFYPSHDPKRQIKNPTVLGDEVLRLIKKIILKKSPFSYKSLANIFLSQTENSFYEDFKSSLETYLIYGIEKADFVETLQKNLSKKLNSLYENYNDQVITDALLLRTCNRVIEYLTTEDGERPSLLFVLLLTQANPLTLVIVLLKIILICKAARTHLEVCIAKLVKYYNHNSSEECQWIINFFEVFNITFAIYAENTQFTLIKVNNNQTEFELDTYRIFSQTKIKLDLEAEPENLEMETEMETETAFPD